ncbi:Thiol-disulfide isomerase or thioredoxin [bacterium A37T11]|nr:Thiol-disulfide isomerase or thioredoxin [bacterium A37T11]
MFKLKPILIIGGLLAFFSQWSSAQIKQRKFSLSCQISSLPQSLKSVKIIYYKYYFSTYNTEHAIELDVNVKKGKFNWYPKGMNNLGYIKIIIDSGKFNQFSNVQFLVEPEDNIKMRIGPNGAVFSGHGAEKYQLTYNLSLANYYPKALSGKGLENMFTSRSKVADSILIQQKQYLMSNKGRISKKVYEILKLNALCDNRQKLINEMSNLSAFRTISLHDKFYARLINNHQRIAPGPMIDSNVFLSSNVYTDYLLSKIRYQAFYMSEVDSAHFETYSQRFSYMFHVIRNSYSGELRDKLFITLFNYALPISDSATVYFDKAINLSKTNSRFYRLLIDLKKNSKGSEGFNFNLEDSTGKTFRLSDFRNKVVVLDMYYYGCHPCADLNRAMTPIFEKYANNTQVVFITVNQDDKKNFIAAVKTGLYTHKGSLNLYTNGQKLSHPFIKYYGWYGAPQQMILDKSGKILALNPLRPMLSGDSDHDTASLNPHDPGTLHLIDLIEEGLSAH